MMKRILVLALLGGCSAPETSKSPPAESPTDRELRMFRESLYGQPAIRVRFRGEWPWAVGRMPRSVAGTVLLGEGERAKIQSTLTYAGGGTMECVAVHDGTRLWRSPSVEAAKFNPGPDGLRIELLGALSWYGLGWSFPQGPNPSTIGQGYVICDLVPQVRDESPSGWHKSDAGLKTISHAAPGIGYRIRASFDPNTRHLRKRELIGEKAVVWYSETYEVELNPAIAAAEFRIPEK